MEKRLSWATGEVRERVPGLVALYTFSEGAGTLVHDSSEVKVPTHLVIQNPRGCQWLRPRGMRITAPTLISATVASPHIVEACQETNELTMEAWVTPSRLNGISPKIGPDRFVTMSNGASERNFTLGQGEMHSPTGCYAGRLRTKSGKGSSINGHPSVVTPAIIRPGIGPDHVVFRRSASGEATIWVNGVKRSTGTSKGTFANWNATFRLAIGSEYGSRQVRNGKRIDERSFLGDIYLIALYSRALSNAEIIRAYKSGPSR